MKNSLILFFVPNSLISSLYFLSRWTLPCFPFSSLHIWLCLNVIWPNPISINYIWTIVISYKHFFVEVGSSVLPIIYGTWMNLEKKAEMKLNWSLHDGYEESWSHGEHIGNKGSLSFFFFSFCYFLVWLQV